MSVLESEKRGAVCTLGVEVLGGAGKIQAHSAETFPSTAKH